MDTSKPIDITTRQAQELANRLKQLNCYLISDEVELMVREAVQEGRQIVVLCKPYLIAAYDTYIIHGN